MFFKQHDRTISELRHEATDDILDETDLGVARPPGRVARLVRETPWSGCKCSSAQSQTSRDGCAGACQRSPGCPFGPACTGHRSSVEDLTTTWGVEIPLAGQVFYGVGRGSTLQDRFQARNGESRGEISSLTLGEEETTAQIDGFLGSV